MSGEFIRKIYLDSRYRTKTSASSSDFEVDLPQSVSIPRRALGWITDLHLPVTWYGMDEHCNAVYFGINAKYPALPVEDKVHAVTLTPQKYTGETLAAELSTKLNANPRFNNTRFFIRYVPSEGTLHMAIGANLTFAGTYNRSGGGQAVLTSIGDASYSVADPLGNPLTLWTGGNIAYQQGRTLIFQNNLTAYYDDAANILVFPAENWTPVGAFILPPIGAIPECIEAQFIKEANLRYTNSVDYSNFTVSGPTITTILFT